MTAREFDPFRLDVAAFARRGAELQGLWRLEELPRIAEVTHPQGTEAQEEAVAWSARGEIRQTRGGPAQVWLHLIAKARLQLECQRCLGPSEHMVHVERSFLFVVGEDAAAAIDADSEHDVLALTQTLDLRHLVEDELLLSLPLVPRHETCPEPLLAPSDSADAGLEAPNPFAALASLKRDRRPIN
jgi:uncharacterized protein